MIGSLASIGNVEVSMALAIVTVIMVAAFAMGLLQVSRRVRAVQSAQANALIASQKSWVPVGPLQRLTFTQSLDPEMYVAEVDRSLKEALAEQLMARAQHGVKIVVDNIETLQSLGKRTELLVTVTAKGERLLRQGKAVIAIDKSGRQLPQLKDAGGRIVEIMKTAPPPGRLAALTAAAVGVAHMISAADIDKQLKSVEKKLDKLLELRRIDEAAALERIYVSARELLIAARTETTWLAFWHLRGELRQLRSAWRRQLESNLSVVDDPSKAGMIEWLFTSKSTADKRVHNQISEGALQLSMIEYALRLDQALAIASDSLEMSKASLADELDQLERVKELLSTKVGYIGGNGGHLQDARSMETGLKEVITHYRGLTAQTIEIANDPQPSAVDTIAEPKSITAENA